MLHPENECQQNDNSFSCCIFGNQVITLIFAFITELLATIIGKNTIYQRYNTDSKLIFIASYKAYKNTLLVVESAILIRYNYQTPKTRALFESIDGPAGRPTDNPPNSDWLGVYR